MASDSSRSRGTAIDRRTLLGMGAAVAAASFCAHRVSAQGASSRMIRLIANENPYGPSEAAKAAFADAASSAWQYPGRQTRALAAMIADTEGVSPDHVMIAAGSTEILRIAALAFGRAGPVVTAFPTFPFLGQYAQGIGAEVVQVPLTASMYLDLGAMQNAITSETSLVYICNPNNPTGTMHPGEAVRAFAEENQARTTVFVDEAYIDLWDDMANNTVVPNVARGQNVIVARTFSKLHGMAGLRVGYAIAPPHLIGRMEALRMSMVNLPGVMAASASYRDTAFQVFSRARIREALDVTASIFDDLGRPYTPSRGNFILFDTGLPPREFMVGMRGRGILTGMTYAPYSTWARVSMGRVEEMHAFGEAAREFFAA